MSAYKIFIKAWTNYNDLQFIAPICWMLSPIMFIFSIFYYIFFKKEPAPINGYKWWDLVEYKWKRAIVIWKWWVADWIVILEENETEILEVYPIEVYPIISWEMKDELEYVNAVQEFQKVTKELEEKANKVKSMRSKVKTIFDK